ncbi:MAG: isochorismatase family cysteine hydrolase [Anaerococcus vaginalis]|uniref:cysteine hydrolase family protein n=1 Tax=Anaerococcus TaxID=165779 RepID=UPI0008A26719|nr:MULTISPECIES: isochorismatase family cysteine hydrolase [Anaerococcus]MDU4379451.1 isochorismatase family cysteine hydrolase [Anaerococcus vaginalis]MDU5461356.1 isochorismatase family cysteine hydrolase [Anaerococcus vaginalis]MDU5825150.1 isochorismatase family cysteine hydrolase [Anaerococcus vaginalis]MDU6181276.1 isochorismatase family cysteine hydrolase [Anaerococcus vaginalis]OFJ68803.1 amidase [Anaerococcus sp. HMSC065G05]
MDVLLVIDLQNDFVDGALGNKGNDKIVKPIESLVENFDGEVIFTRDTHDENYLESLEGSHLPVKHCIKNSKGWQIKIDTKNHKIIDKPSFGSYELVEYLKKLNEKEKIENIYMVGICTDICVLSNAILIKNALLDTEVTVIEDLCKATNEKNHKIAIEAMKSCQVNIVNSKGE